MAVRLRAATDRLVARAEHWAPARWAQPAGQGGTRADVVHALVQRLADKAAAVEHRAPRPVPRLDNDLALPDQVRVMVADLMLAGAGEDVLRAATADIESTATHL